MPSRWTLPDHAADAGVSEIRERRERSRRWLGTAMQGAAWIVGCGVLAVAAWVYLIETYDPRTGAHYDGLGRELRGGSGVLGLDRSPGLWSDLVDTAAAVVLLCLIHGLYKLGERLKKHTAPATARARVAERAETAADRICQANSILDRHGLPRVGVRVRVTLSPDRNEAGVVADAFATTVKELGVTEDGVTIMLDNGTTFEEFVEGLTLHGVTIEAEGTSN